MASGPPETVRIPGYHSAAEILADADFPRARIAHIEGVIALFGNDRFLIRLLADSTCLMTAALLVGLHAAHDEHDRRTWATLGRVQKAVVANRLASARRVDDLIARFRDVGYIRSVPSRSDRRVRILVPSAAFLAQDRSFVAALYRSLNVLYPARGYDAIVRGDARLHLAIRRVGLLALPRAKAFIGRHPAIMRFLAHDAGYLALLLVARALLTDDGAAREDLSYTALAERLGVSRTHIRNLFVEAAASGHVRVSAAGGQVLDIRPALWEAFDRFLADLDAGHDSAAQTAFASLHKRRPYGP